MPFLGYFFFFFNLKTVFSKMKYKKVFIFGDLRHFPATPDVYKANFYPRVFPRVVFGHFGHFSLKAFFSKTKSKKVIIFDAFRGPLPPNMEIFTLGGTLRVVFGHFGHFSLKAFSSKTKLKLPKLPKMPKLLKLPKFEVGPKNKRPERSLFFGKESISGV